MSDWQLLGPVLRLQIHTRKIVYGGEYHDHPELRRFLPQRQLSIGFTGHYTLMAETFGSVPVGVAAENIIVDHPGTLAEEHVSGGLLIEAQTGPVELRGAAVAKPCVQFTKFLLGAAAEESVAEHRALLDNGVRGFVLSLIGTPRMMINRGDQVYHKVAS